MSEFGDGLPAGARIEEFEHRNSAACRPLRSLQPMNQPPE